MKRQMIVMAAVLVLVIAAGTGGWFLALASRHKAAEVGKPGVTENALNKWGLTSANSFGVVARKR